MRQISLCSGHGICDSTMIGGINNIPSNEVSDHGLEYGSHVSKLFNNMDSARPEYRYFSFGLLHQYNLVFRQCKLMYLITIRSIFQVRV